VDAVIAHEIGHVKRNHILFYLFFFVGYILFSYAVFDLIVYAIIYTEPLYRVVIQSGLSHTMVASTLITLVTIVVFLIYFRYIFGYFMRNFERQADCYVYTLFNSAGPLISTFEKIVLTTGQAPDKPNWHHFSIAQRVKYLIQSEQDRGWVLRHDRKVRRSIVLYGIGMALVAVIGYSLNFGETGRRLNANLFETVIEREIREKPDSPELFGLLGDLYYSRNEYAGAVEAYEKAILLGAEGPEIFNNLAWLYATCEEAGLRSPERALELAQKALSLSSAPHILDTLAESYFVNGRFDDAVSAGLRAYEAATADRSYFEGQLKKFREAAGKG
jgi:tetratricopeptide (TPR) repeat protein